MNIDETLTQLFVDFYKKMKKENSSYIPDTAVAKEVLLLMYEKFVRKGLTPIEDLSHEDKVSLTTECRKTGNVYTNKTLTDHCKMLYLILVKIDLC